MIYLIVTTVWVSNDVVIYIIYIIYIFVFLHNLFHRVVDDLNDNH